ncbi:hypothetical protein Z945_2175 [Sulfitobacter noctilucae]|nr:hypothetical protein Z945_2175 [Sulfitobacter noctilucae]
MERFLIAKDHDLAGVLYRVKASAFQLMLELVQAYISFDITLLAPNDAA